VVWQLDNEHVDDPYSSPVIIRAKVLAFAWRAVHLAWM
jgi:hypothetical protein